MFLVLKDNTVFFSIAKSHGDQMIEIFSRFIKCCFLFSLLKNWLFTVWKTFILIDLLFKLEFIYHSKLFYWLVKLQNSPAMNSSGLFWAVCGEQGTFHFLSPFLFKSQCFLTKPRRGSKLPARSLDGEVIDKAHKVLQLPDLNKAKHLYSAILQYNFISKGIFQGPYGDDKWL